MAYSITKTDGTVLIANLEDKSQRTVGGINLFGRGLTQYGIPLNENFVSLLESFASTNPPAESLVGQVWYDTSEEAIKVKVRSEDADTSWKNISTANISDLAPANPAAGDLWYDTSSGVQKLKVYVAGGWVVIGPYVPPTGDTEVAAGVNSGQALLFVKIANTIVAIFSNGEFVPSPAIVGFAKLYPGLNLRNTSSISTAALLINDDGVTPVSDNTKSLGTSGYRFKEIWAADFKGNTTSATSAVISTNADNIKVTSTNANTANYPTMVTGLSGYAGVGIDTNLTYNPSTNILDVAGSVKTGILESTIATGTAPIKVASTTKVDNLRAEQADKWTTKRTVTFSGDVTGTLEIDGSANINGVELSVSQTNFATPTSVANAISTVLPPGSIIMWYGNYTTIPTGWAVCDGQNGTPNLTNKFIVAAAKDINSIPVTDVNGTWTRTGGTAHTVVPTHSHSITDQAHSHSAVRQNSGDWQGTPEAVALPFDGFSYPTNTAPDGNVDGSRVVTGYDRNTVPIVLSQANTGITSTNATGVDGNFTNVPPFFAVYYIMRKFPTP